MIAHEAAALQQFHRAPGAVQSAIRAAGSRSSADFAYLVRTASVESNFNPAAKATTSSASGMYQFVEATWMEMVEGHGNKIGLGAEATAIRNGTADAKLRQDILDLRHDPKTAAFMAQAYADQNRDHLEAELGRNTDMVDQYLAHFLGPTGATTFLKSLNERPGVPAAELLPAAAAANGSVFYDAGRPRSVAEVHAYFSRKLGQPAGAAPANTPFSYGATVQTQQMRADAPTFAANTAFMVHVLLETLSTGRLDQTPSSDRQSDDPTSADRPVEPTWPDLAELSIEL